MKSCANTTSNVQTFTPYLFRFAPESHGIHQRGYPLGLSEIIVRLPTDCPVPEFGEYLCPSNMTIDVSENHSRCFDWVQRCINKLPFPKQIGQLTINITMDLRYVPVTYSPNPADYQVLCDVLNRLYKDGSLRYVNLNLTIGGGGLGEDAFIQTNEVRKLRETFAALFDENALAIKLVFMRLQGRHCVAVRFTTKLY